MVLNAENRYFTTKHEKLVKHSIMYIPLHDFDFRLSVFDSIQQLQNHTRIGTRVRISYAAE